MVEDSVTQNVGAEVTAICCWCKAETKIECAHPVAVVAALCQVKTVCDRCASRLQTQWTPREND